MNCHRSMAAIRLPKRLGEQLGLSAKKVREVIKTAQLPISLELPMGEDADSYIR